MSLIITRGLGDDIVYRPVGVDKPKMETHEWGKKTVKIKPSFIVVSEDQEQG
jgi:hypothetical protein